MAYSKTKQCYVLGTLVPLGQKHVPTPNSDCQIVSKFKLVPDALVSVCTGGLFTMKSIKCYVPESDGLTSLIPPPKPIIDNGLQYEFEFAPVSLSFAISYKFAKRFSIGVGYAAGANIKDDEGYETITSDYVYDPSKTQLANYKETKENWYSHNVADGLTTRFYFNGQIRPWDKNFSPILGANVGWQKFWLSDETNYGDAQTKLFVAPYAGFSVRCGSNNYLSLKVGYNLYAGKIKPEDGKETYTTESTLKEKQKVPNNKGQLYETDVAVGTCTSVHKRPEFKVSTVYVGLNFTHTMRIGAGLHEKAADKIRNVINK